MSSLILLLLFIGTISADFQAGQEFEVKQGSLLNNGRSYTIKETGDLSNPNRYTIQNDLFSLGKKIVLLENGKPLYEFKHALGHLYQKWKIYDVRTGDDIATFKHRPSIIHDTYKVKSTKFGYFYIEGSFGSRTFTIKRNGHKVGEVYKKHFHLHDTYSVQIEGDQDPAIILLIAIGIDEVRQH